MADTGVVKKGVVEVTGGQLYYESAGQDQPLVLVHAGNADRRMWDEQMPVFAQRYRVIRYDLRGYGENSPVTENYSHYKDLHILLNDLGIEKTYLVGCSMGGMVAIDFTLTYPEMVKALVAVSCVPGGYFTKYNPNLTQPTASLLTMFMEVQEQIKQGNIIAAADQESDYWFAGPHRIPGEVPLAATQRRLLYEMNRTALKNKVAAQGKDQELEPPAITRLGQIAVPTLVVTGEQDDPDLLQGAQMIADNVPNTKRATVEKAGHMLNMENPELFNRLVLDFLNEIEH